MSNFFRKLFCCGAGASSPVAVEANSTSVGSRSTNSNRNSLNQPRQRDISNISHERRRHNPPPPKPVKKFLRLKSSYSTDNIKVSDTRTEESRDLKFQCPICFRYFDKILMSSCCQNYMCHFCANDLNDKVKKDDKIHIASCPFCASEDFDLNDVDPNEKPKKYTDSFYSTFKSNGGFANKLGLKKNDFTSREDGTLEEDLPALKAQMSASDGAIYMQRALQSFKPNRSVGTEPNEEPEEQVIQIKDYTNVIAAAPNDDTQSFAVPIRESISYGEERKSNGVDDDSINDRLPIDVIQEAEFEYSMATVPDRQQSNSAQIPVGVHSGA